MNKEKNFVIYPEKQTTHTRKCDGCSKCCEGFLSADIYGFDMSLRGGKCKFLVKQRCGIYPVRPDLCKVFLCGWRENTNIPDNLKPSQSHVILLPKYIENYFYYRIVVTHLDIKDYVYEWANIAASEGKHLIGYQNSTFKVFSNDEHFKEIITKKELG
jgi:hypothetical protein